MVRAARTFRKRARTPAPDAGRAYAALAAVGRPDRRRLVTGVLVTRVPVACPLAFPWPLRGLVEVVFHRGTRANGVVGLVPRTGDPVAWLVASMVVIILLWGFSESLQRLSFTRFAVGLVRDARATALERIPDAGDRKPGELISAVTGDAARVKSGIKSILIGASRNGAFFVGVAIIIWLIDALI